MRLLISICLFFLGITGAIAQNSRYSIPLRSGAITPEVLPSTNDFTKSSPSSDYMAVQFNELPTVADWSVLKEAGVELEQYLGGNAFLLFYDKSSPALLRLIEAGKLRAAFRLTAQQRMTGSLYLKNYPAHAVKASNTIDVTLTLGKKVTHDAQKLGELFTAYAAAIQLINVKMLDAGIVTVRVPQDKLTDLVATNSWILFAAPVLPQAKEVNSQNRAALGAAYLSRSGGLGLDGTGISICIGDGGAIDHADFRSRTVQWSGYSSSFHANHVAGTLVGAGVLDPRGMGMAPKATLVSEYYEGAIINTPQYITNYQTSLTNNSWGSSLDMCSDYGDYTAESNYLDLQIEAGANDQILHVFAAGNSGSNTCSPLPTGYHTTFEAWQAAKNNLVVANMQANGTIASTSSRGPVADGRIKPEIAAIGTNTYSTLPTETYGFNNGTSMASPAVTGTLALIQQRYKQTHGSTPINAALLKALVLNTADDYGNAAPDYTFGYGSLNARRAVAAMDANNYFAGSSTTGSSANHSITVPTDAKQLRVLLYWADKAAAANVSTALVNNLNLTVNGVNPWILDPNNPSALATQGIDNLNNVEQVTIDNPTAGSYTATVTGAAVPMGTQPYYIVYEVLMPTVQLTFPNGEDKLDTNEAQLIRWEAYDDDTNTFTLEYSTDGGTTWTVIDNAIVATARQYAWTTPNGIASAQCRMRITRNSTANTDMSDADFTIIGVPVLSYLKECPTYLQVNWTAVAGATSYEVLQINTQTEAITSLTTTASLGYLVEGLSTTAATYITVRALAAGVTGRRALSTAQIASGAGCAPTTYDNDMGLEGITAPLNGRLNTSTALPSVQNISYRIRSRDNVTYTGTGTISYQINGGATVSSAVTVTALTAGSSQIKSITMPTNTFSTPGIYTVVLTLTMPGDNRLGNNVLTTTIIHANNQPVTLPFTESFESLPVLDQIGSRFAVQDNTDFTTGSSSRGRLRTAITNTNARTGNRALTLDAYSYSATSVVNDATMTINLSAYTTADLRLSFAYKQHSQNPAPGNFVWIRGNNTATFIPIYDLYTNQAVVGSYKEVKQLNIKQLLANAGQTVSSSFQIKFGQEGTGQVGNNTYGDGYTFDDVKIELAANDIGIKSLDAPVGCTASAGNSVIITLENTTANPIGSTTIPLAYTITSPTGVVTTVNESITTSFAAYGTQSYTFTTPYSFAQNGLYTIAIAATFTDDNTDNNTLTVKRGLNDGSISTYPYLQGFEAGTGGWYHSGTNDDWTLGTPAKTHLSRAANGTKAFVTKTTGNYSNQQDSYLYSPCFDLTSLTTPVLSFSFLHDIEYCANPSACDYTYLEYSTDGFSWTKLGTLGAANSTKWYNESVQGWTNADTTWHVASLPIPAAAKTASTRFRWNFHSDQYTSGEGIGIDDIHIFDKVAISAATTSTFTQSLSGNNWTNVLLGGNLIAQINPQGNNLGSTTFKYYNYTGALRFDDTQYYMDRNLVIQPTTQPLSPVKVRIFFLKTEIDEVINGSGCPTCSKPSDAYLLGISKYTGNPPNEDDNISNNGAPGTISYISRNNVEIIPYDNGYYAEFSVTNFSEFWANHGGDGGTAPLPVQLTYFNVLRHKQDVSVLWETESELNNAYFDVEVARSDKDAQANNWAVLGTVRGHGTTNLRNNYTFLDTESDKIGNRYYRLRQTDYDGHSTISPVRMLHFAGRNDWSIFPNPATDILNIRWKGTADEQLTLRLTNVLGQTISEQQVVSTGSQQAINFDLNAYNLPAGVYNLIVINNSELLFSERVVINRNNKQ